MGVSLDYGVLIIGLVVIIFFAYDLYLNYYKMNPNEWEPEDLYDLYFELSWRRKHRKELVLLKSLFQQKRRFYE